MIIKNQEKIKHYFELLFTMTAKEIKVRYKNTFFGFLWMILNPVFQMIIIGIVFSWLIKVPIDNYYLFLFSGLLPWQFFSLSLTKATPSFVYERYLLQKSKFPREIIPLSIILSNFYNFFIALILLSVYLYATGNNVFPEILLFVPASIMLLIFTTGLSFITSTMHVKYRDIQFFIQSLIIGWFYATPIIYPYNIIPSNFQLIFALNPLTSIIQIFQKSVTNTNFTIQYIFYINILLIIITALLGVVIFKKNNQNFTDWL